MLISFPFKISGFLLIKTLEKTFPLEGTDYVDKKQAKQEYHLCLCSQNQIPKLPSLLGILKAERNVLYMFPVRKSLPPLLESGFFAVSLLHRGDETFLFHIVLKESANEVSVSKCTVDETKQTEEDKHRRKRSKHPAKDQISGLSCSHPRRSAYFTNTPHLSF